MHKSHYNNLVLLMTFLHRHQHRQDGRGSEVICLGLDIKTDNQEKSGFFKF